MSAYRKAIEKIRQDADELAVCAHKMDREIDKLNSEINALTARTGLLTKALSKSEDDKGILLELLEELKVQQKEDLLRYWGALKRSNKVCALRVSKRKDSKNQERGRN